MVKRLPEMQIWVQCLGWTIHGEGNVYLPQYNFSLNKKKVTLNFMLSARDTL